MASKAPKRPPTKAQKSSEGQNGGSKIDKATRTTTEMLITELLNDPEKQKIDFPSYFTNCQRQFVHTYARRLGLTSKSSGNEKDRVLTVFKTQQSLRPKNDIEFEVDESSLKQMFNLLKNQPLTQVEKNDVSPKRRPPVKLSSHIGAMLNQHKVSVPPFPRNVTPEVAQTRMSLPIFAFRQALIETVYGNQAVVVSGDTGSGKTTQVPQYILEHASENGIPCRIICAQPRRLSAIAVAERVCYERGEECGHTVGYQIRLESKTSPTSNLIYCTNGVLLRCLMGKSLQDAFKDVTHIIVDEVHERDKYSDFLLICLKRALEVTKHVKVILMSATIDVDLFSRYLSCPIMQIPGRTFPVKEIFLEEVLVQVGYQNELTTKALSESKTSNLTPNGSLESALGRLSLDPDTLSFLNGLIERIFTDPDPFEACSQFLYVIEGENVDVNYKHPETDMTALMAGSLRGAVDFIQSLLALGANPLIKSKHEYTARKLAEVNNQSLAATLLVEAELAFTHGRAILDEAREKQRLANVLLAGYQESQREEEIDHNLLAALIAKIHEEGPEGAILVFLPGYSDIIEQAEFIEGTLTADTYALFLLHSHMETKGQRSIFTRMSPGVRKIVLSTNIAETSITIDDVTHVIDAGKVKQQTFDSITGSSCLSMSWISRACAKQRAGRAGRCQRGFCYRLFSRERYHHMPEYTLPELLRVSLTEICIQAKMISGEMRIADFLQLAIQPPGAINIERSIQILQVIGALDEFENITLLGKHLGDIPADVKFGKMLIFAVLMRCLDPVLTIVAALSVPSPFLMPVAPQDRAKVAKIRQEFGENSFSDHFVLLRLYQSWSTERQGRSERAFCRQNFVRQGTMETITSVRSQLLSHLRAYGFVQNHGPGSMHELNWNSGKWACVKACLVAGLYPNIAHIDRKANTMESTTVKRLGIHRTSVLRNASEKKENMKDFPTEWICFEEKVRVAQHLLAYNCTLVTCSTIALFSGPTHMEEEDVLIPVQEIGYFDPRDADQRTVNTRFQIDPWLHFVSETSTAYILYHMRQKLYAQLQQLLHSPSQFHKHGGARNQAVVKIIAEVLENEESLQHLGKPQNVGRVPQAVVPSRSNGGGAFQKTPNRSNWRTQDFNLDLEGQRKTFLILVDCMQTLEGGLYRNNWSFMRKFVSNIRGFLFMNVRNKAFVVFHVQKERQVGFLSSYTQTGESYKIQLMSKKAIALKDVPFILDFKDKPIQSIPNGEEIPASVAQSLYFFCMS